MDDEKFLKCIVDNNRRIILNCLGDEELCVNDIIERTGLEQTLVSFHLKKLKGCGLVVNRRDGKKVFYSMSDPEVGKLLNSIKSLSSGIKDCCNDEEVCGEK